ncbi:hypothetical protein ACHAXR_000960 [Thalassiosira sp. AJA248-18]
MGVKSDFSDLEQTVRYVMDPDNWEQMQQIVKSGQQFCRTKLTMEQYTVDILWTLLAYADLLAGSPDFYDAWRNDKNACEMPKLAMAPWKGKGSSSEMAVQMGVRGISLLLGGGELADEGGSVGIGFLHIVGMMAMLMVLYFFHFKQKLGATIENIFLPPST